MRAVKLVFIFLQAFLLRTFFAMVKTSDTNINATIITTSINKHNPIFCKQFSRCIFTMLIKNLLKNCILKYGKEIIWLFCNLYIVIVLTLYHKFYQFLFIKNSKNLITCEYLFFLGGSCSWNNFCGTITSFKCHNTCRNN